MKVFSLCYSYYHVAQTLALCDYLITRGASLNLTIFRGKFLEGFRVNSQTLDFSRLPYPVTIEDMPSFSIYNAPWAAAKFVLQSFRLTGTNRALVNPNGPHLGLLSAITASGNPPDTFFSIEDGLGTHGSILYRSKAKTRESSSSLLFPLFLVVETLKIALLRVVTFRSGALIRLLASTPQGQRGKFIELAPHMRKVLSSGVFAYERAPMAEGTVLFLSQPYVEMGLIDAQSYLDVVKAAEEHFNSLGKRLQIKAHPAEDLTKWHSHDVCDFDGPVEVLLAENQCTIFAVIGISSTALILAKRLFGLRAFRVQHPALSPLKNSGMNSKLESLLEQHSERLELG